MAKLLNVSVKAVLPVLPSGAKEQVMLEEDVCRMECHELMQQPRYLKYNWIVAEFLVAEDNRWIGTVC